MDVFYQKVKQQQTAQQNQGAKTTAEPKDVIKQNWDNLSPVEQARFNTYKSKASANDLKIVADLAAVASKPSKERKEIIEKTPIIESELHYLGQKDNDAYKRLKTQGFCYEPVKGEKGAHAEKDYWQTLKYFEQKISEAKLGQTGIVNSNKVNNLMQETTNNAQQRLQNPEHKQNLTSSLIINKAEFEDIKDKWLGQHNNVNGNPNLLRSNNPNLSLDPNGTIYHQFRCDKGSLDGAHKPPLPHFHLELVQVVQGKEEILFNNHILLLD